MKDWMKESPNRDRVAQWLHTPTGVELFIKREQGIDEFGLYVQTTRRGPLDKVSIGDAETGLYKMFSHERTAKSFAENWMSDKGTNKALREAAIAELPSGADPAEEFGWVEVEDEESGDQLGDEDPDDEFNDPWREDVDVIDADFEDVDDEDDDDSGFSIF